MPAIWRVNLLADLWKAIETLGEGARKVEGDGYKVYRIGATIRCDLKPEWIPGPEEEKASEGSLEP